MRNKINTGLIHIYCGDGKGKTTAGMGLCVRAAAAGLKVVICQFMKDNSSSERSILGRVDNIILIDGPEKVKFSFQMSEDEKRDMRVFYEKLLKTAEDTVMREHSQVLFLDEVIYCINAGLLPEDRLIAFLNNKPEDLEVILTGQNPEPALIELADYVSEIRKVKHPYDAGVEARTGIER